jgi:hypothetical protein
MPPFKKYTSKKQEAWAHTESGLEALGFEDVKGKDKASKGAKLPTRSPKKKAK